MISNNLLYRQWVDALGGGENPCLQLVLLRVLVSQVLKQLHDSATAGHLGVQMTLGKIRRRFYWVGQRQDMEDWCHRCEACAARKPSVPGRVAPMQSSASGVPFQMDIVGPVPRTDKGSAYILVIGDYFTMWIWKLYQLLCACMTSFADMELQIFCTLIKTRTLCKLLGIVKTRTTPYHPH